MSGGSAVSIVQSYIAWLTSNVRMAPSYPFRAAGTVLLLLAARHGTFLPDPN